MEQQLYQVHRLELTNEALLGQSERLQERMKRLEEEGSINSRIIQVEAVDYDDDDDYDDYFDVEEAGGGGEH